MKDKNSAKPRRSYNFFYFFDHLNAKYDQKLNLCRLSFTVDSISGINNEQVKSEPSQGMSHFYRAGIHIAIINFVRDKYRNIYKTMIFYLYFNLSITVTVL